MIGEVPAASGTLLEFRQHLTVCDSTFIQQSRKGSGQWTIQVYMILMSPSPLLCPTELCHSYHIAVLQLYLSILQSQYFLKTIHYCIF